MRAKIIICAIAALCQLGLLAQDRIIRYQGDTITCIVVEIDDNIAKYKFPGEDLTNTEHLLNIKRIILNSGREIEGPPRVEIFDEDDWEKVRVASDYEEVKNLELVTEIQVSNSSPMFGSYADINDLRSEAIEDLKKRAAILQCHVIYLTSDNSKTGITGTKAWPEANLTANIYRFRDRNTSAGKTDSRLP